MDVFLTALPGLEEVLRGEVAALGYEARAVPGGVTLKGSWPDVWRLNLWSACAGAVLVRAASFRATHLAELDKRAGRADWGMVPQGTPITVEATAKGSKLYHTGAIAERVRNALAAAGAVPSEAPDAVRIAVRVVRDQVTISLDTSGAPLFRRGHKLAVGRAPLRETMAASLLRMAGHVPGEAVLDPFCGSGTIILEAAARGAGLAPGRDRTFAFEKLAGFDAAAFAAMREEGRRARPASAAQLGSDRDRAVVAMAAQNAERGGLAGATAFLARPVSEAVPPDGEPGLVLTNPPYGARLGEAKALVPLYRSFGAVMRRRFAGWRVGLVTSEERLARATGLDWAERSAPIPHGPLRVRLWTTGAGRNGAPDAGGTRSEGAR